jgi:GNAT superfamily N-acetyltransferase
MAVSKSSMKLTIRPLTPDLWPALEDLFGKNGACNGCWCMYWRIGSAYRVDVVPVWSLSCFYVRKGYRKRGVTSALIAAALKAAKRVKAPALEAYPLDADLTPSASGTGYASTFARAGFKTVTRHVPPRPIMRHDLKAM